MSHPLQQRVGLVRRWWNRRATWEFVCWAVAACLAIVLVFAALDFAVRTTDRGLRFIFSIGLGASIVAVGWQLIRRWSCEHWNEPTAAQALQREFPQLGDRLASALEFLKQDEDDPTAGSAPLRRAVVADATAILDDLPAEQVAQRRSMPRAMAAAVAALLIVTAVALFAPTAARTAIARLAGPWNNAEWPRRNNLVFAGGPSLLARGDTFEVSLTDESGKLPSEVAIEYRYQANGSRRNERSWMQRVGDTMVTRRENVQHPFEYRATGGDHRTMPWTKVDVVDRPMLLDAGFTIHPPSYTGLSNSTSSDNIRVLAGSSLELDAMANQPLSAAVMQATDDTVVPVSLGTTTIHLQPGKWFATTSKATQTLRPWLSLTASTGLTGTAPLPLVEVVADEQPQVTWVTPAGDLFVVAGARVPLEVRATDDIALASSQLAATKTTASTDDDSLPYELELFALQDGPPLRDSELLLSGSDDTHQLSGMLDLTVMNVKPGDIVELTVTATDFKPQTGTVATSRRLTIVTSAELDSQLAADQAEILRLLEQALADQRAVRSQVKDVATQLRPEEPATREIRDQLLAARLTQQGVRRTLTGEPSSVAELTQAAIDRVAMNRLNDAELVEQLQRIAEAIAMLGAKPLPAAEAQLTELHKILESQAARSESPVGSPQFASAEKQQSRVVEVLEALVEQLSAWSDADRFVRELARLEQQQRELREQALKAARQNILAQADAGIEPIDAAERQRMVAAQADLARQFDKLIQAMRDAMASGSTASDLANRLNDAVAAAESMGISAQLAAASQEIGNRQLGRAAETQLSAADAISELVERLRDRPPTDPAELASRLRKLQQQLADLKQQAAAAEQERNASEQDQQRRDLQQQLARVARDLERLTAQQASESTKQASSNAAPKSSESPQQAKQDLQQAQRDIEQAEQQLAQRIAELEGERQQRLLDRLAQVLDDLVPRQQQALEQTLKLELQRESLGTLGDNEIHHAKQLSSVEAQLASELSEAMIDVERRAVFQLALGGATADMQQAGRLLQQANTGRVTQNLELSALSRMRHVLDILRDPPPPPPDTEQPPGGGGGAGGAGQPQKPPLIELAEVKMLRWLQLDLNTRTRLLEADLADNASMAEDKRETARRLASEQQQLEELVREMMRRNNNNVQPPVDL